MKEKHNPDERHCCYYCGTIYIHSLYVCVPDIILMRDIVVTNVAFIHNVFVCQICIILMRDIVVTNVTFIHYVFVCQI